MKHINKVINKLINDTTKFINLGLIQFEAENLAYRVTDLVHYLNDNGDDLGYDGYRFSDLMDLYNCLKGWYLKGSSALIDLPADTFRDFENE